MKDTQFRKIKPSRLSVAAIATISVLSSAIPLSGSEIVFSNFQGNALRCGCYLGDGRLLGTSADDPTEHWTYGNAFTTPFGTSFSLDSVELAVGLISGGSNSLLVFLYSDRDNGPSTLLETFQIDNGMGAFGQDHLPVIANSIQHPQLKAGSQYWLLATTADANTGAGWYVSNTEDVGPVGDGVNGGPFCCVRTDLREAFAVFGTPAPTPSTPEISTFWMLGLGLSLVIAGVIRRSLAEPRCSL